MDYQTSAGHITVLVHSVFICLLPSLSVCLSVGNDDLSSFISLSLLFFCSPALIIVQVFFTLLTSIVYA